MLEEDVDDMFLPIEATGVNEPHELLESSDFDLSSERGPETEEECRDLCYAVLIVGFPQLLAIVLVL